MTLNEAQTRVQRIDPQLRAADWKLNDRTQVRLEVPVDGYDAEPWNGVTDYCLYDASGNVLAVVEAKRSTRHARDADEQLRHYVTEIAKKQPFAPFGFMANGHDIWFWEVGLANPRLVAGFFTPADLGRLKFLRQNRQPLEATPINNSIVDRSYQHEAIRRIAEAFANNKRRALLVMATGTGKTRTAMALIDIFLRASQAQNVLFLADRDALVEQALTDGFKAYLPHEPRDRIYTYQVDIGLQGLDQTLPAGGDALAGTGGQHGRGALNGRYGGLRGRSGQLRHRPLNGVDDRLANAGQVDWLNLHGFLLVRSRRVLAPASPNQPHGCQRGEGDAHQDAGVQPGPIDRGRGCSIDCGRRRRSGNGCRDRGGQHRRGGWGDRGGRSRGTGGYDGWSCGRLDHGRPRGRGVDRRGRDDHDHGLHEDLNLRCWRSRRRCRRDGRRGGRSNSRCRLCGLHARHL